jgi:ketosteroid isomerase-like protein
MSDTTALFRRLYSAFNARDVDRVVETLDPDVEWAAEWGRGEGDNAGVVVGRAAVRDHLQRHFEATLTSHRQVIAEPLIVSQEKDGRQTVDVNLVVRDGNANADGSRGKTLSDRTVQHVYTLRHGGGGAGGAGGAGGEDIRILKMETRDGRSG